MTVSECIKDWLKDFEGITKIEDLCTDRLESAIESYEIFKSPNKDIIPFADGSSLVTEYYQFFGRKAANDDSEMVNNQQVLTNLENWIEKKNFDELYPDLSQAGTLHCEEISIENSATVIDQTDSEAIYQITIKITYKKEISNG
jgi:hypothetical protein